MLFSNLHKCGYFVRGGESYDTHACVEFKTNPAYMIIFRDAKVCRISHARDSKTVMVWRENASPVEVPVNADMPMDVYQMQLEDSI